MIFDLYAVVRNFDVNLAHNLIGNIFWCLFFLRRLRLYSLFSDESESLDDESNESFFLCFRHIIFVLRFFTLDLL